MEEVKVSLLVLFKKKYRKTIWDCSAARQQGATSSVLIFIHEKKFFIPPSLSRRFEKKERERREGGAFKREKDEVKKAKTDNWTKAETRQTQRKRRWQHWDRREKKKKWGMEKNRKKWVRKVLKGNRAPLIYWSLSCCLGRASSNASLSISLSLFLSSASLVGDQRVNGGVRGEI